VVKVKMTFYIDSGDLRWMAGGSGADSIFQFRLDGMKRCQKMKRTQRAHLDSMRRKCNTTQWHDNVNRRRGDTGEGKGMRRYQLGCCESYWAKK
jgi:hypothetical protein